MVYNDNKKNVTERKQKKNQAWPGLNSLLFFSIKTKITDYKLRTSVPESRLIPQQYISFVQFRIKHFFLEICS